MQPTHTLGFWGAPFWSGGVQTGCNLMPSDLKSWIAMEVSLTTRMDVSYSHSTTLRGQGE